MAKEGYLRKITAIFSADVVGFSRLMEDDESATVSTLDAYRKTMFAAVEDHRGRVIDSPGDNILAEFASVVDAVQCAVEIQQVLASKNAELPANRKMTFRIGINLGDVIVDGQQIYGDGVNLAARIESLADPGSVCISGSAYEQIKSKLALGYEDLGNKSVKNITEPIRVYRIPIGKGPASESPGVEDRPNRLKRAVLVLAVGLVLATVSIAFWGKIFVLFSSQPGSGTLHGPETIEMPAKPDARFLKDLDSEMEQVETAIREKVQLQLRSVLEVLEKDLDTEDKGAISGAQSEETAGQTTDNGSTD